MAVVASSSRDRVDAMTIDTLTPVCLDPATVLVCLASDARTTKMVLDLRQYTVSILGGDQAGVARRFAAPGAGRFPDEGLVVCADGQVLVAAAVAALRCRVVRRLEAGDHVVAFGEVTGAHVRGGPQLIHCEGALSHLVVGQAPHDTRRAATSSASGNRAGAESPC